MKNIKKIIFFTLSITAIVCLAEIPEGFVKFTLKIIDLPFPPYQRNVIRMMELDGKIYGIIAGSERSKGSIFMIENNGTIVQKEKLPEKVLQPDSVIFNQELTWTWNKNFSKIIVLDRSGTLKIHEVDGSIKRTCEDFRNKTI